MRRDILAYTVINAALWVANSRVVQLPSALREIGKIYAALYRATAHRATGNVSFAFEILS